MKSINSNKDTFSMKLNSEKNILDEKKSKKKKIIITTSKSSKKEESDTPIQINNENDFMKTISKLIKDSNHCKDCKHLSQNAGNSICTNFQALWHHRDNRFNDFTNCNYKSNKELSSIR